jgi:hypothetical protein
MKDIDKILIFLTFALIYSSIVYITSQTTEIELDVSNSLIYDLINQKYDDGTYQRDWEYNYTIHNFVLTKECDVREWNNCSKHIQWNNQTLNSTTHIKVKIPINQIIFFNQLR